MPTHHRINYIELPATDIPAAKAFYAAVFGWTYTDYGDQYASFNEAPDPDSPDNPGLDGGLSAFSEPSDSPHRGPLVVFYSDTLEATRDAILAAGGTVLKPIFDFPGGRRFHFTDPAGNELAVWGPPEA